MLPMMGQARKGERRKRRGLRPSRFACTEKNCGRKKREPGLLDVIFCERDGKGGGGFSL